MTSAPRAESGSAMATHGVGCSSCIWGQQVQILPGRPFSRPMTRNGLNETLLQSLRYSSKTRRKLHDATSGKWARPNVDAALDKLKAAGLVSFKWNLYSLTKAGRNALPSVTTAIAQQGQWKPEPVVRRQGSCTKHLPSRYGDRLEFGGRI